MILSQICKNRMKFIVEFLNLLFSVESIIILCMLFYSYIWNYQREGNPPGESETGFYSVYFGIPVHKLENLHVCIIFETVQRNNYFTYMYSTM
jgi:hypothetical protein